MNANADSGEPFGEFAAERCAAGDEGFDAAAEAIADFREDQFICELPGERGWSVSCEYSRLVGTADGKRPAVDRMLGKSAGLHFSLGVDFFVNSGHGNAKSGAHLKQRLRKALHKGTVG